MMQKRDILVLGVGVGGVGGVVGVAVLSIFYVLIALAGGATLF